jgi:transposase-like protein
MQDQSTPTRPSFLSLLQWSEDQCRNYLELQRWPNGPICPKCGAENPYRITRKTASKNRVQSLFRCRDCKRQYTVTVGTIMEDSKIPLNKWLAASYLMCSSKKGISAHQLHRMLDLTHRSAWWRPRDICYSCFNLSLTHTTGALYHGRPFCYPPHSWLCTAILSD